MTYTPRDWKLIFGGISVVTKLIAFTIAVYVERSSSDLTDLAVGGIFLSSGFVHILPRAESHIGGSYPYASLVAVCVFVGLTLFAFVRDSIALMDENILTNCETINYQTSVSTDLVPDNKPAPVNPFAISEQFPTIFLYITDVINTIAAGIWLSTREDLGVMTDIASIQLTMQALELIAVGKYVHEMPIPSSIYWILAVIASGTSSVLIAMPISEFPSIGAFSGYACAVTLGVYFFLGSIAVHKGLTETKHNVIVSSLVLLLSFAIPTATRALIA
jgi:hypothetical protein